MGRCGDVVARPRAPRLERLDVGRGGGLGGGREGVGAGVVGEALDGVEVIDLSDLQVRSSSGHLYHIYNPEVGDDLAQLFKDGLHAAERRNLVQDGPNLWRLQPAQ